MTDEGDGMSRIVATGAVFALIIGAIATGSGAQGLVSMQKLSAPLANELVGDTVAICAQKGYTVDNAFFKAYSAASLTLARKEDSTKAVAERMAKAAPTTVPSTPLPNVTYAVGGVTIMAGGAPIGAIGVSGAPGGQFDDDCARAAIAKIQDRMK
jgi:uncharacterized protein GlcG (DUF336 family)